MKLFSSQTFATITMSLIGAYGVVNYAPMLQQYLGIKSNAVAVTPGPLESMVYEQPIGKFKKQMAMPTEGEQIKSAQKKISELIHVGKALEAELTLVELSETYPHQHEVRAQLANLYLIQERLEEAENVLVIGLKMNDRFPGYLHHMATLLHKKGDSEKALTYLLKLPQEQKNTHEIMALFAATYYQAGMYDFAVRYYTQLVNMNATQSKWWLGLALSLDASNDFKGAQVAYQKTHQLGGVEPSVIKYIDQRMAALQEHAKVAHRK